MHHSLHSPRTFLCLVSVCALGLSAGPAARGAKPDKDKLSIDVKSAPTMGFAPFKTILTVDVKGGPDDNEQLYCASVEWDLGDGTTAEQKVDCDPYEAGKSQIKRRYVREQVFNTSGEFRVVFRLKQKSKVVASGQTTVRVRPGLRDDGGIDR